MRILHTADWQIGQIHDEVPGERGRRLRRQRIATVGRLAQLANEERVDAVLVAGGIFAPGGLTAHSARALVAEMSAYSGPWVLLPDSTDPGVTSRTVDWLATADLPPNIIPAIGPDPLILNEGRLAVLPFPAEADLSADVDNRLSHRQAGDDSARIGLAYRPSPEALGDGLDDLDSLAAVPGPRLDYLALGGQPAVRTVARRARYSGSHESSLAPGLTGYGLVVERPAPGEPLEIVERETSYYTWSRLPLLLYDADDVQLVDDALSMLIAPDRHLVYLELAGMLEAADGRRLGQIVAHWRKRLYYLETDLSALIVDPSADDRAALAVAKLIADTTEQLEQIRDDPQHPDRELAEGALRRLYQRYIQPRE